MPGEKTCLEASEGKRHDHFRRRRPAAFALPLLPAAGAAMRQAGMAARAHTIGKNGLAPLAFILEWGAKHRFPRI